MRRAVFTLALVLLFTPSEARACLCPGKVHAMGFLSHTRAADGAQHLPANAKGVLFYPFHTPELATAFTIREEGKDPVLAGSVVRLPAGVVRVEPPRPFEPGHEYTFEYRADKQVQTHRVHIELDALQVPLASNVKLELEGSQELGLIAAVDREACSQEIPGAVQRIVFAVPAELERYRDSLLYFTFENGFHGTRSWEYRSSMCGRAPLGRSELGPGKELLFAPCKEKYLAGGLELGRKYSITGRVGFLEVEDQLVEVPPITVQLGSEQACTSGQVLEVLHGTEDRERLRDHVCQTPLVNVPARLDALARFAEHDDSTIRECAVEAIVRGFEKDAEPGAAVVVLSRRLVDDDAPQVRERAASGIATLLPWRPLSSKELNEVLPRLIDALKDDWAGARLGAAASLTELGGSAARAGPALFEAMADTSKPNPGAPIALAAVVPDHPELVNVLVRALDHPNSHQAGAAAFALRKIERRVNEDVITALVRSGAKGNHQALLLLARFGPKAASVLPELVEIARRSESDSRRMFAMEALVAIAPHVNARKLAEIRGAIVENLRRPSSRGAAIDALARLGLKARPALPDLLAVVDVNSSDNELTSALHALGTMSPPKEKVKPLLLSLLHARTESIRNRAAHSYLALYPTDGKTIALLLRTDDASTLDTVLGHLSHPRALTDRQQVFKALAAILRDDARPSGTHYSAIQAVQNAGARNRELCEALRHCVDANKTRHLYMQALVRACGEDERLRPL